MNAFTGIERIQFIVPVERHDLEPIPETVENLQLARLDKTGSESPEKSLHFNLNYSGIIRGANKENKRGDNENLNGSGIGDSVHKMTFDRSDKKFKSDKSSFGQANTFTDKGLSESINLINSGFNLEPQIEQKPVIRLKVALNNKTGSSEELLCRNIEFLLGESSQPGVLDDLKDERETTKLALSKTILNIHGSFLTGSVLSTGTSTTTPFVNFDGGKDLKRLQKSLSDLQRDGKPKSSYCNPCQLI